MKLSEKDKAILFKRAAAKRRGERRSMKDYGQFVKGAVADAERSEALASLSFISCRGLPKVKIWSGARRVQVSIPDDGPRMRAEARKIGILLGQVDADAGKRGKIDGFSAASRRRLFEKLSTVRRDSEMPIFYTLTIPRELYVEGVARAKEWHVAFFKRILRVYPLASVVWKLEPQADGTAHFHGLLWGVRFIPWQKLSVMWSEVMTGEKLPDGVPVLPAFTREMHEKAAKAFRDWVDAVTVPQSAMWKALNASTRVEAVRGWRGVMFYAGKYIGKEVEGMGESGRFWGVLGRKSMPWAECEVEVVEFEQAYKAITLIRRRLRAFRGWEDWIERARTLVCEDPEIFWRFTI